VHAQAVASDGRVKVKEGNREGTEKGGSNRKADALHDL
jgi:hypothetical protein